MPRIFIALGSNIDPENNLRRALQLLAKPLALQAISTIYRTAPIGRPDQPPFLNAVAAGHSDLPPLQIKLDILRSIETLLARQRTADRYAPRTIDLDLILYGQDVVNLDHLQIPDPDILHRPFLAIPLFELAPDLCLPGSNRPIADLASALRDPTMQPLPDYTRLLRTELGIIP